MTVQWKFLGYLVVLWCMALVSMSCLAAEPESAPKVKGVGVVLGGGGARGFAHLGVLKELDRLHVPISCIAGTSAGALIGGMYANGLPLADMEQAFNSADWDQMLSGKTTRSSVPYDRKRDDYKNYMDVTLGMKNGQIRVPRSAINSQEIDLFIRKLTRDRSFDSFDQMPIPFRAIATNLSNGDAVVFDKGPLALALRSSMAVPGVFDLVEDQGRLLVDGGLARNLPVQEVKGRCADHVIVVDVSAPLLKPDEINSLFDVVAQTSNIMVDRNVREQLRRLDKRDLVVRPQLDAYTSASFADNKAIIALGEEAAHHMAKQLSAYAVSPEDYARWKQSLVRPAIPMVDDVRVQGTTAFVNIQSIEKAVEHKGLAEPIDVARDKLRDIFAQGDYDQLDYSLDTQSGRNVMTVMPVEKSIGPNYLRFGLNLKGSAPGDASFTFLAAHQRTWANRAGASWRNELSVGDRKLFKTEFYQPWSFDSPLFAATSFSYNEEPIPLYSQGHVKYAELTNSYLKLGADLGVALGQYGEVRLGAYRSRVRTDETLGNAYSYLDGTRTTDTGLRGSVVVDQYDNPRWPRHGYFVNGQVTASLPSWGSSQDSRFYSLTGESAQSLGEMTVRLTGKVKGNLNRNPDDYRVQSLGGFLNLTGYQTDELLGARVALARLMMYWRAASLPSALGSGVYAGASLEMGKVWQQTFQNKDTRWIPAGSLFIGADTLLGPFFIGVGYAEQGRLTGYLYLGVDY